MFFLLLVLVLASCTPQPATAPEITPAEPAELIIFAAASLVGPFSEIGELFEASHFGDSVLFNFAGSQALAQQINEGAPADVFASANQTQMVAAIDSGGVAAGTQQVFAMNRLVVIFPTENPGDLAALLDLAKPGLKLVLAAQDVPVGRYSLDFLEKTVADPAYGESFKDAVLTNVVSYEDNVKAVLAKVALGEADAGIVYTSDISGAAADKVDWLDIPDALNMIAAYPIAPVTGSKNLELAQAFIGLVLSPEGQAILAAYNFIPVE